MLNQSLFNSVTFNTTADEAGSGSNEVFLTLPAPTLTAAAHDRNNAQVALTLPSLTLTVSAGVQVRLSLPAPIFTATATSPGYATAAMELPEFVFTAHARTGETAQVALSIPIPTLTSSTGAYVSLVLLAPVLTASGTVTHLARAELTLPFLKLTATAKTGAVATVATQLPDFTFAAAGWVGGVSTVVLTLPALILTTYEVGVKTESTYSVNLNSGAVTQLLLGSFDKLVTAHGRLYGLRSGELVYLEGETDMGISIPATVRFAQQTFSTNRAKRLSTVYFSTRENDGLTMEVVADETTTWHYQTATDNAPAFGTHKIKTGRGIKFHTAGLVLRNRNGGRMDIGGMELIVEPLSRRPKT